MKRTNFLTIITATLLLTNCGDFNHDKMEDGPLRSQTNIDTIDSVNFSGNLSSVNEGVFNVKKLVANLGLNIVNPSVRQLNQSAIELQNSIELAQINLLKGADTIDEALLEDNMEEVKEAFNKTMLKYHFVESFKFGPINNLLNNETTIGLNIYSWPATNACQTYIDMAKATLPTLNTAITLPANNNVKGLDAIETLLFTDEDASKEDGSSVCSRGGRNKLSQIWTNRTIAQKYRAKLDYMSALAREISKNTKELAKSWSLYADNYTNQLLLPSVDEVESLNTIFKSLFFLEKDLKDLKMATPSTLGDCSRRCAKKSEHILNTQLGFKAIIENLKAYQAMYLGLKGFGFDDLLLARKYDDIDTRHQSALVSAIANFEAAASSSTLYDMALSVDSTKCIETTSEDRQVELCALYKDIKKVTDILKIDIVTALNELSAPKQSQGDND